VPTSIEFGEYWLLETAVDGRVPLYLIEGPPSQLIEQWNKKPHGLSERQLIETLHRLFQAGDISAVVAERRIVHGETKDRIVRDNYTPTLDDLQRAFRWEEPGRCPYVLRYAYGLTAQGGVRWEQIADPDWSRFYEHIHLDDGERTTGLVVTAGSTARAEEVLERDFPLCRLRRISGIDRLDELRPWHATYWKTLPVGYRLQWACEPDPNEPYCDVEATHRPAINPEMQRALREREIASYRWHDGFPK
jgi:hypothetical protein